MPRNEATEWKPPEDCRACKNWKEVKERVRLLELLESAIDKMQKALMHEGFKPSVGDYAKLVQMEKDLDEVNSGFREIKVTWVDPSDAEGEE